MKYPYLAMNNNIIATPTLVRESDDKNMMLVGDFTDHDKVLSALDI